MDLQNLRAMVERERELKMSIHGRTKCSSKIGRRKEVVAAIS